MCFSLETRMDSFGWPYRVIIHQQWLSGQNPIPGRNSNESQRLWRSACHPHSALPFLPLDGIFHHAGTGGVHHGDHVLHRKSPVPNLLGIGRRNDEKEILDRTITQQHNEYGQAKRIHTSFQRKQHQNPMSLKLPVNQQPQCNSHSGLSRFGLKSQTNG